MFGNLKNRLYDSLEERLSVLEQFETLITHKHLLKHNNPFIMMDVDGILKDDQQKNDLVSIISSPLVFNDKEFDLRQDMIINKPVLFLNKQELLHYASELNALKLFSKRPSQNAKVNLILKTLFMNVSQGYRITSHFLRSIYVNHAYDLYQEYTDSTHKNTRNEYIMAKLGHNDLSISMHYIYKRLNPVRLYRKNILYSIDSKKIESQIKNKKKNISEVDQAYVSCIKDKEFVDFFEFFLHKQNNNKEQLMRCAKQIYLQKIKFLRKPQEYNRMQKFKYQKHKLYRFLLDVYIKHVMNQSNPDTNLLNFDLYSNTKIVHEYKIKFYKTFLRSFIINEGGINIHGIGKALNKKNVFQRELQQGEIVNSNLSSYTKKGTKVTKYNFTNDELVWYTISSSYKKKYIGTCEIDDLAFKVCVHIHNVLGSPQKVYVFLHDIQYNFYKFDVSVPKIQTCIFQAISPTQIKKICVYIQQQYALNISPSLFAEVLQSALLS